MSEPVEAAAPFLTRHLPKISPITGPALDLACGRGRNVRAVAALGRPVLALDRDRESLRSVAALGVEGTVQPVLCDLESGDGIPVQSNSCAIILVFRFLFRPLSAEIARVLKPGGHLFYETFTTGQREHGFGPRRTAFLLEPGELRDLFPDLETLEYEEGTWKAPRPHTTARLWARKPRG